MLIVSFKMFEWKNLQPYFVYFRKFHWHNSEIHSSIHFSSKTVTALFALYKWFDHIMRLHFSSIYIFSQKTKKYYMSQRRDLKLKKYFSIYRLPVFVLFFRFWFELSISVCFCFQYRCCFLNGFNQYSKSIFFVFLFWNLRKLMSLLQVRCGNKINWIHF